MTTKAFILVLFLGMLLGLTLGRSEIPGSVEFHLRLGNPTDPAPAETEYADESGELDLYDHEDFDLEASPVPLTNVASFRPPRHVHRHR